MASRACFFSCVGPQGRNMKFPEDIADSALGRFYIVDCMH